MSEGFIRQSISHKKRKPGQPAPERFTLVKDNETKIKANSYFDTSDTSLEDGLFGLEPVGQPASQNRAQVGLSQDVVSQFHPIGRPMRR